MRFKFQTWKTLFRIELSWNILFNASLMRNLKSYNTRRSTGFRIGAVYSHLLLFGHTFIPSSWSFLGLCRLFFTLQNVGLWENSKMRDVSINASDLCWKLFNLVWLPESELVHTFTKMTAYYFILPWFLQ